MSRGAKSPGGLTLRVDALAAAGMDKDEKPPRAAASPKPAPGDGREARLAAALRANLRRRKAAAPKPAGKPDR
jgi:hypothetical protein